MTRQLSSYQQLPIDQIGLEMGLSTLIECQWMKKVATMGLKQDVQPGPTTWGDCRAPSHGWGFVLLSDYFDRP